MKKPRQLAGLSNSSGMRSNQSWTQRIERYSPGIGPMSIKPKPGIQPAPVTPVPLSTWNLAASTKPCPKSQLPGSAENPKSLVPPAQDSSWSTTGSLPASVCKSVHSSSVETCHPERPARVFLPILSSDLHLKLLPRRAVISVRG